ncbi:uncharacterized protein LOC144659897 isoform X1 [Oculina patagonica]
MLAIDAQNKLKKASAEVTNLTEELKICKAENAELVKINSFLQIQEKELQQQLNESSKKYQQEFKSCTAENAELKAINSALQSQEKKLQQQLSESTKQNHQQLIYITELQKTLVDTDRVLKEVSFDILKKEHEFKSCKEREKGLKVTNASLKQQVHELEGRLEDLTNAHTAERVAFDKELAEKAQEIVELKKSIKEEEEIISQHGNSKELQEEEFNSSLKELQEKLGSVINTQTAEREEIDRVLEEKLQQIVELSGQLSARNVELEKENQEKKGIIAQLENCQGQQKELQERLDDMSNVQTQIREQVTVEQEDMSEQIVELQKQIMTSNAMLQNVDLHEKRMAELLENCKEQKEKLEQACDSFIETIENTETTEMPADHDVVDTFNERGKELEMENYLRKYQPEEVSRQERMDDVTIIQIQIRDKATPEQADMSQQFVEVQNQIVVLQNVDFHEKKMAELLENCNEEKKKLEQACDSFIDTTSVETTEAPEMLADVVDKLSEKKEKLEQACDSFIDTTSVETTEAPEMLADVVDKLSEEKIKLEQACDSFNDTSVTATEVPEIPADVMDKFSGGGYLNVKPLMSVAMTNNAEPYAEQNIPVLSQRGKVDNDELKSAEPDNTFSRAALKGQDNFGQTSSSFDDFSANSYVGEQSMPKPGGLGNVFDDNKGVGYFNDQPLMSVGMSNDAEFRDEQDIPLVKEKVDNNNSFDDFIANRDVGEQLLQHGGLGNVLDYNKGGGYLNVQPLNTATMTYDAELNAKQDIPVSSHDYFGEKSSSLSDFPANSDVGEQLVQPSDLGNVLDDNDMHATAVVEEDIPVLTEKTNTNKLKTSKPFNPFSRAALKGKGRRKSLGVPMTNVSGAHIVRGIPVPRKRHETGRAEGFSYISETVDPYSMSAGGIQYQPAPLPFYPVSNPTASQLAHTKKDDDWRFPRKEVKLNIESNPEEQGFFSRTIGKWFGF